MTGKPSTVRDPMGVLVGNRAVKQGLIGAEQFRAALAEQQRDFRTGRKPRRLSDVLVEMKLLTEDQVRALEEASGETAVARPVTVVPPKLFGRYQILKEIGRGGMGLVYQARDMVLDRVVALKVLRKDAMETLELQATNEQRFLQEAQLAAILPKHPNLVGVHDAGVIDGLRYIVMEFIEGRDLGECRADLSPRRRIAILAKAARAVHHAHEHDVIHRDLKPANILVDAAGEPHVTDFGLARRAIQDMFITSPDLTVGTPAYMSPEQARGLKSVDRRSDVYSLGVLLYEIITDRTPYDGETAVDLLLRAIEEPLPKPSEVAPDKPLAKDPALEGVCLRALAKKADNRFPTALEFAEALEKWVLDQGPPSVLKGQPPTVRVPVERKAFAPALWATTGGAAVLIVVAAAMIANGPAPPPPAKTPPKADPIAELRSRIESDRTGSGREGILAALDEAAAAGSSAEEVAALRRAYLDRVGPVAGQVAHFGFEEDDASDVPRGPGHAGKALVFDGTGRFKALLEDALDRLPEGDYSVSVWFRPDAVPAAKDPEDVPGFALVMKGNASEGLSYSGQSRFAMQHARGKGMWSGATTGREEYPPGRWYHVTGVVDRTAEETSIYVDGQHKVSRKWPEGGEDNTMLRGEPWRVGIARPDARVRRWPAAGAVDELRFFKRALTADDVKALYEHERAKPER